MRLFRKKDTPSPANTTAVILAGGRSERFGERKGWATLKGRPLVQWAARLAAACTVRTLLVVPPDEDDALWWAALRAGADDASARQAADLSLEVLHDERPYTGPVGGIEAALPVVSSRFVLLLAVDMPLLRPDLVLGLNDRLVGHDAVAYHLDGWWRPFPSLWKRDALVLATKQAERQGIRSLHGLLDLVDARPLGPEFLALFDAQAVTLKSVNTKDDLAAIAARLDD